MDRKLILSTLLFLLLQITILVADVDLYFFADNEVGGDVDQREIGVVIDKKQNVKRRGHNSIVWEDSEPADRLLINDSVLTLENSSVDLQLQDDVKISLHENTLIVLEPPDSEVQDSLRIRFSRGDFLTRTQNQRLHVGSGEWQIDATPGSHFSVKSLQQDTVEVEIMKGSLEVGNKLTNLPARTLRNGTKFVMQKNKIENVQKISSDLKFISRATERIYSHKFPVQFMVHWQGEADQIRIVGPSKVPQLVPVATLSQTLLNFEPGTHYLSLLHGDKISSEILIHAVEAPRIRYTSPLPRDRFELDQDVLFSWMPHEGVSAYELELTSQNGEREKSRAKGYAHKFAPKLEGELQMRVWGEDADGFRIPPFYSLPLYMVRDPLAPPQLNAPRPIRPLDPERTRPPQERLPSNDDSAYLVPKFSSPYSQIFQFLRAMVFGPLADASESVTKIVFSWQDVPGADFYNIEISSNPDFQKPEVITKIFKSRFTWSLYKKQIYYWRVAAGANSGRMGIFSDTASIDLTHIDQLAEGEIAPGVQLDRVQIVKATPTTAEITPPTEMATSLTTEPPQTTAPQNTVPESAIQAAVPKSAETPDEPNAGHWSHTSYLRLLHVGYSLEGELTAGLNGFAKMAISHRARYHFASQDTFSLEARYLQLNWRPESEAEWPYQAEFTTNEYALNGLYKKTNRDLSYGGYATTLTTLKRKDLESVVNHTSYLVGPSIGLTTTVSREIEYEGRASLVYGDQIGGATSLNDLNYLYEDLTIGGELNFIMFFGPASLSGFYLQTGLHLGYSW